MNFGYVRTFSNSGIDMNGIEPYHAELGSRVDFLSNRPIGSGPSRLDAIASAYNRHIGRKVPEPDVYSQRIAGGSWDFKVRIKFDGTEYLGVGADHDCESAFLDAYQRAIELIPPQVMEKIPKYFPEQEATK